MDESTSAAVLGSTEVPVPLRNLRRFIPWDLVMVDGRATKKPRGSVLDPSILRPLGDFAGVPRTPKGGVGLVFTGHVYLGDNSWLIAADLDACRDPRTGDVSEWAETFITEHARNSYTEISPSRTGLRVFLIVHKKPTHVAKIRVPQPAPDGVDKRPEIEFFGCSGAAQYVTVTFDRLPGTSREILAVDLDDIRAYYRVPEREPVAETLPVGVGPAPSHDEIAARIAAETHGAELLAGDWAGLALPSASEAWFRLVRAGVPASDFHGEALVDFLLHATPWGQGLVDSRDPGRYMREDWVARDVARVASKVRVTPAASVFAPVDADTIAALLEAKPEDRRAWVVQFDAFAVGRTQDRFLVYGVLPACGLAQMFGDPGCGKTPFAVSLALHIANDQLGFWFGHEIDAHGDVVYMIGEDATGIVDRFKAQAERLSCNMRRVFVTTRPGALVSEDNRMEWVRQIRETVGARTIRLLVIDTQARNFGPGNENATDDMGAFIDQIQALATELDCCVLLVHHTGHMNKERGRGSSALPAALDAQFEVSREGSTVVLATRKMKNAAWPKPVCGLLVPVQLGVDRKGRPRTAITIEPKVATGTEVFSGLGPEMVAVLVVVRDTRGEPTTQEAAAALAGITRRVWRDRIEQLQKLGLVAVERAAGKGSGKRKVVHRLTDAARHYIPDGEKVKTSDRVDGVVTDSSLAPDQGRRTGQIDVSAGGETKYSGPAGDNAKG